MSARPGKEIWADMENTMHGIAEAIRGARLEHATTLCGILARLAEEMKQALMAQVPR